MTASFEASRRPVMDHRATLEAAADTVVIVVTRDRAQAQMLARAVDALGAIPVHVARCDQAAILVRRMAVPWVTIDLWTDQARELIDGLRKDTTHVICIGGTSEDRVWALRHGSLDAIGSVEPEEVALRLSSLIRRQPRQTDGLLHVGELSIDIRTGTMSLDGQTLPAHGILVRLAAALAQRPGELVSIPTLLDEVWGEPWARPARLHQAIRRLKRCLGPRAGMVVSHRGLGYGLDANRFRQ